MKRDSRPTITLVGLLSLLTVCQIRNTRANPNILPLRNVDLIDIRGPGAAVGKLDGIVPGIQVDHDRVCHNFVPVARGREANGKRCSSIDTNGCGA
jgi:hypothetical protein